MCFMALQKTGSQPCGRGSDLYPATGWCTLLDCLNGSFTRVCVTGPPRPGYQKEPPSLSEAVLHLRLWFVWVHPAAALKLQCWGGEKETGSCFGTRSHF